jgi:hypothetical protein
MKVGGSYIYLLFIHGGGTSTYPSQESRHVIQGLSGETELHHKLHSQFEDYMTTHCSIWELATYFASTKSKPEHFIDIDTRRYISLYYLNKVLMMVVTYCF